MTFPSILIAGLPGVGKNTIFRGLLKLRDEESETGGDESMIWNLETKYYSAKISLSFLNVSSHDENLEGSFSEHEALVLVFDQSNVESFEILQKWATKVDISSFETRLCIGNKADKVQSTEFHEEASLIAEGTRDSKESDIENLRRRVFGWCVDNGMEFIESCAVDPTFDKNLSNEGDEQGLSRIKSALEAHMWPGLEMRTDGGSSFKEDSEESENESDDFSEDESEISIEYLPLEDESPDDTWRPYVEAQIQDPSSSGNSGVDLTPSNLDQSSKTPETSASGKIEGNGQTKEKEQKIRKKDTVSIGALEKLMGEMRILKENMEGTPDDLRRNKAAEMAVRMARLFGEEEESD